MISADGIIRKFPLRQPSEKTVKKLHGLCRRNRPVIKISRKKNSIRFLFINDSQDFIQNIFLIFNHGKFIDSFSKVKIG